MGLLSYAIGMKSGHLAKITAVILVLSIGLVFLSGQSAQVRADPSTYDSCYPYYGYCDSAYYWYYYGYYPYYYYYSYPYARYYGYYGYPYYYYGYGYNYYAPPSKYQLTVTTDPLNIASVSGSGTYDQGTSASFSLSQNTVQVSPTARYIFAHWSGDYSGVGTSGSITMNDARKIIAVYQLQYYLDVNVQPQAALLPQGAGWYNAGDTVTVNAAGQMLGGDDGTRLVFQGWNIDEKTPQPGVSLVVKMDSPHAVTAEYKQQYYLQVSTDQGVAYGQGWYDTGSTAQIYVSTPVSTSYGVSIIFDGWQGDLQSGSQSTTVLMDKPKAVIASWRSDPTVLNLTIALVIIAVFLAGAGIVAYVAVSRKRFSQQALTIAPAKTQAATAPSSPHPAKQKFVPLKKKSVRQQDADQPTAEA
jgi:hypothetical protein